MAIRNGRAGDGVWIDAIRGVAYGMIYERVKRRYRGEHVYYRVRIIEPGDSRFIPGAIMEIRALHLSRRNWR